MTNSLIRLASAAALVAFPAPLLAQAAGTAAKAPTRAAVSASLESQFTSVDKNGDKSLDTAEIGAFNARAAQQANAAVSKRLDEEFAKLDTNKDKQISVAEFKAVGPDAKPTPAATTLQRFDSNKDQKVSLQEYGASMLAVFDKADANKDGTLSDQEQQAVARAQR